MQEAVSAGSGITSEAARKKPFKCKIHCDLAQIEVKKQVLINNLGVESKLILNFRLAGKG